MSNEIVPPLPADAMIFKVVLYGKPLEYYKARSKETDYSIDDILIHVTLEEYSKRTKAARKAAMVRAPSQTKKAVELDTIRNILKTEGPVPYSRIMDIIQSTCNCGLRTAIKKWNAIKEETNSHCAQGSVRHYYIPDF